MKFRAAVLERLPIPKAALLLRGMNASRRAQLLEKFDAFFGPWDPVDDDKPFVGNAPRPEGAGFYPADMSKADFDAYLAANPGQAEALTSPYTVVKREGDRLVAVQTLSPLAVRPRWQRRGIGSALMVNHTALGVGVMLRSVRPVARGLVVCRKKPPSPMLLGSTLPTVCSMRRLFCVLKLNAGR